jgi:sulfate/thiosulfate transport system permease protein
MSTAVVVEPRRARASRDRAATALSLGFVTLFLTVMVALPIAALVWEARSDGAQSFWDAVTEP